VARKPLTEWQYRVRSVRSWIAAHSHLYHFLNDWPELKRRASERASRLAPLPDTGDRASDTRANAVEQDESSRGWKLTFDLLERIDEVTRGLGARLVLVTIPPSPNALASSAQA